MDILQIKEGINLIYKPVGPTSHDIVDWARKQSGIRCIGHAGTLDPFAEGLLILLVGREYTRRQSEFLHMDKVYETAIHLGATSNTDDCTGIITSSVILNEMKDPENNRDSSGITLRMTDIEKALTELTGTYEQMPPHFSAKKISGTPAYKLARKGQTPELKPKQITIYSIEILSFEWPLLSIRTQVSSGTYIRALARDIGEKLHCGGYCETLKRTSIGPYLLIDALRIPSESLRPHRE